MAPSWPGPLGAAGVAFSGGTTLACKPVPRTRRGLADDARDVGSHSSERALMSTSNCPDCGRPGRMLQIHGAWVDYHVCDDCHAGWTIDYRDPKSTPILITKPKSRSA